MAIERRSLRSQVRDELLARMRAGEIRPGEGINEVQLSTELGVSRTPLREALIALESEGQIESASGKGFRFVPLSAHEFEELCPIIVALESLALELTPVDALQALGPRLQALANEFSEDVAEHALLISRDDEWHHLMLSECPNGRLLEQTEGVRLAIHRYESLLVPDSAMVGRNAVEHTRIAVELTAGNVAGAKKALAVNWVNATRRIVDGAGSAWEPLA